MRTSNVFPLRNRPDPESQYSRGWIDGSTYAERVSAWKWRMQGAAAALVLLVAVLAIATYLGGL